MVTSHQLGISSVLMAGSNSTKGGVMGKIICICSIVVAVAATGWQGGEARICRFGAGLVISGLLCCGILTMLQALISGPSP